MSDESDLDEAFRSGRIFDSSPDDMKRFLRVLGHINVNGDSFQVRAVMRTLTINHLQMAGVIKDLNIQNGITAIAVKRLTWLAVGLAALQVAAAVFFVWRDFNPRKVAVDKEPVSHEAEHDASPPKDESTSPVKPLQE